MLNHIIDFKNQNTNKQPPNGKTNSGALCWLIELTLMMIDCTITKTKKVIRQMNEFIGLIKHGGMNETFQ